MAERLNSAYTLLKQAVPTVKQNCRAICMRSGTPRERTKGGFQNGKKYTIPDVPSLGGEDPPGCG